MRPAVQPWRLAPATIRKYLLRREQSPESISFSFSFFMKFYVDGRKERGKTDSRRRSRNLKQQRKKGWKKREEVQGSRCKRWTKSGKKRKKKKGNAGRDEKEQRVEKHVRWLSDCRTRNSGRRGATYIHVWPKRALCFHERIQLD